MTFAFEEPFSEFHLSPPAPPRDVELAERGFGRTLPSDYRMFLLRHDGGEGFVGKHYLILWKAKELVEFNKGYQVQEFAPELIVFGSSGGGDGFAFDTRTDPCGVMQVPLIGMSLKDGFHVAQSFDDLLQRMKKIKGSLF